MAHIIERTFSGNSDKTLVLRQNEYMRPLGVQNQWSRVRIGILAAVDAYATVGSGCGFYMGICSGKSGVAAYDTMNFVGACMCGVPAAGTTRNMSYSFSSNTAYMTFSAGQAMRKWYSGSILGSTITAYGSGFSPTLMLPCVGNPAISGANPYGRRAPVIVEIIRPPGGGGTGTVNVYGISTTVAVYQTDYSPQDLQIACDMGGTPIIRGQTLANNVATATVTMSEMEGALDTVNIYWSNSIYPLEIYAIVVSVIHSNNWPAGTTGGAETSFGLTSNVGTLTTTIATQGTGWTNGSSFQFVGSYGGLGNYGTCSGWQGTSAGWPVDWMSLYPTGTVTSISMSSGTGWIGAAAYAGTSVGNIVYTVGFDGTSSCSDETFEQYPVGAVTSGVTINAGTNWSSYGTIS